MSALRCNRLVMTALLTIGCLLIHPFPVRPAPTTLDNHDLKEVTAGTAATGTAGGVVVGNGSEAAVHRDTAVKLSGGVQIEARGLNLVNSTDSTVANGVNVWDGSGFNAAVEVNQLNSIEQEQRRSAAVEGYHRAGADTLARTDRSESESHDIQRNVFHSAADLFQEERVDNRVSEGVVDTGIKLNAGDQLNLEANVGSGVAAAGQLEAHYDGGEVQIALAAGGGISAGAGIGAGGFAGIDVGVDAQVNFSVLANIQMPEMDIALNGGGCGVILGSCNANGSTEESVTTLEDHSILDTFEEHVIGHTSSTQSVIDEYRSAFMLDHARAEYIVVDHAILLVDDDQSLNLSGDAQSNVRGMNVVNAVDSAVANAVNVARNARVDNGGRLTLNQTILIHHSR